MIPRRAITSTPDPRRSKSACESFGNSWGKTGIRTPEASTGSSFPDRYRLLWPAVDRHEIFRRGGILWRRPSVEHSVNC
jgi:hypothetical protein